MTREEEGEERERGGETEGSRGSQGLLPPDDDGDNDDADDTGEEEGGEEGGMWCRLGTARGGREMERGTGSANVASRFGFGHR